MEKVMQGHSVEFTVDATEFGDIEALEVHLYSNNIIAQKFKHPETAEFAPLTKNGYIYEGVLKSSMTDEMLGVYGIIPIGITGDDEDKKGYNPEFIEVTRKPL